MAFKKGESGNPSGKAKPFRDLGEATIDVVTGMAKSLSPEAVLTLRTIMRSKRAPWGVRVTAANSIIDRGFGKPVTYNAEEDLQRRDIDSVSDAELAADIERLRQAERPHHPDGKIPPSNGAKKPH